MEAEVTAGVKWYEYSRPVEGGNDKLPRPGATVDNTTASVSVNFHKLYKQEVRELLRLRMAN